MKITKLSAIEKQLDTAIELYFLDKDPISIHTLMWASRTLCMDLSKASNIPDKFHAKINPECIKKYESAIRSYQNFLKHADNDSTAELDFNIRVTESLLYWTIWQYSDLVGQKITKNMEIYNVYYCLKNPHLLRPEYHNSFIDEESTNLYPKKYYWDLYSQSFPA